MNEVLFLKIICWPLAVYCWPCFIVNLYWHFTDNRYISSPYTHRIHYLLAIAYLTTAILISLP